MVVGGAQTITGAHMDAFHPKRIKGIPCLSSLSLSLFPCIFLDFLFVSVPEKEEEEEEHTQRVWCCCCCSGSPGWCKYLVQLPLFYFTVFLFLFSSFGMSMNNFPSKLISRFKIVSSPFFFVRRPPVFRPCNQWSAFLFFFFLVPIDGQLITETPSLTNQH